MANLYLSTLVSCVQFSLVLFHSEVGVFYFHLKSFWHLPVPTIVITKVDFKCHSSTRAWPLNNAKQLHFVIFVFFLCLKWKGGLSLPKIRQRWPSRRWTAATDHTKSTKLTWSEWCLDVHPLNSEIWSSSIRNLYKQSTPCKYNRLSIV